MCPPPSKSAITHGKPEAEIEIDAALVRRLLESQHPDLAALPLAPLASGWDNVMYRLGDGLTVRLPRRAVAAELIVNEQTWLPLLAPLLPIPISAPVRIGRPTDEYPWHWSVLPYFRGHAADQHPPAGSEAGRWAMFLLALHQPAPPNAPVNEVRGIPLVEREGTTNERLARLRNATNLITPAIERLWARGLAAPRAAEPRWLHGDLHAQNVLVHGGVVTAVVDWGDITGGDVATDLASVWGLFEDPADRERTLTTYGPDQHTLDRARGWAVLFGAVLLDSGLVNSARHAAMGRVLLTRLGVE